jgi:YggT family protein
VKLGRRLFDPPCSTSPKFRRLALGGGGLYMSDRCSNRISRMHPVIWLILTILDIYVWILIAAVVLSWLLAFNIINRHNDIVRQATYALSRLTEPVLGPIRRFLPDLGGLDVSPVIAIIIIYFIRYLVVYYGARML